MSFSNGFLLFFGEKPKWASPAVPTGTTAADGKNHETLTSEYWIRFHRGNRGAFICSRADLLRCLWSSQNGEVNNLNLS
ncbi:hypothetical protein C5748_16030 [Phyllobacterium phragmitis]|uniref:Uncharacterized protein n=1 Tax=Phyllobacterium phragmitis TaxID=2670329 RepID=A0A2S9IPY9_9HYPH|nr:hypothetical protein C5748_16030 [Phyllobacterium phragmitis]